MNRYDHLSQPLQHSEHRSAAVIPLIDVNNQRASNPDKPKDYHTIIPVSTIYILLDESPSTVPVMLTSSVKLLVRRDGTQDRSTAPVLQPESPTCTTTFSHIHQSLHALTAKIQPATGGDIAFIFNEKLSYSYFYSESKMTDPLLH